MCVVTVRVTGVRVKILGFWLRLKGGRVRGLRLAFWD